MAALLLAKIGFVPSFSSTESSVGTTQDPSVVTPIFDRKNARVPDEDCGMTGTTAAVEVPPTSFHLTVPVWPPPRIEASQL